jgi:DNA recombination protein RmuC
MVVRMPGGRSVIVDAKTPIDAFLNSLEATTDEKRAAEMARHGRHVKEHVKRLSTRAYSEAVGESADFTVLFLPNESFLYAALEVEADIVEFALQKKVLIATPPTLIGLLKVIRYGWNEQKMAENAQRISEMGQELHKRICDFVETYVAVGKHLDKAREEFEKGRGRLESRLLVQARRFEALGAKSNKTLLDAAPEV